jgi:predicted Kef-type K+ transport protein
MTEAVWVGFAYLMGLVAKRAGLPALIGYLGAGFVISQIALPLGLPEGSGQDLKHIAHIGVLLLLFTVGLKLKPKKVAKSEVIGTSLLHFVISAAIFAPVIYFAMGVDLRLSLLLASCLSFSSTVLVAKVLEGKNELKAFHGRVAIGVLIIQDLVAMVLMSATSGELPTIWALWIFALPLLYPLFHRMMDASGHDEMLILCGLLFALVIGGGGFAVVNLSGELGALVLGAMLASNAKATELSDRLWGLKELFLVAFFLSIGMNGLPSSNDWIFALTVVALLPLQGVVFFFLLLGFKLKARSAFLTSVSLTNFSEFGLIVAATAMPEWIVPLALAVALSFLVSAPLNRFAHPLFDRFEGYLSTWERDVRHPDEEPLSIGNAEVLIVGMGRVGRAAYHSVLEHDSKKEVACFDSDQDKVECLVAKGYPIAYADAEHNNFWATLALPALKICILSMNCSEACKIAITSLREAGYQGRIVAHTMHEDEVAAIQAAGADATYETMTEAGDGLARHALELPAQPCSPS